MMTRQAGRVKKWILWTVGIIGLLIVSVLIWAGPTVYDLYEGGFLSKPPPKVGWTPDTEKNLHVLYTALKLQHDSDGQFPKSSDWMNKIIKRVRTENLKKGAEQSKFVDPAAGGKLGEYGFAMNDAASEKYIDDIKDKSTPLIFQSTDTSWSAHGDPKKIGRKGGIGIAVDGTVVKL